MQNQFIRLLYFNNIRVFPFLHINFELLSSHNNISDRITFRIIMHYFVRMRRFILILVATVYYYALALLISIFAQILHY